MSIERKTQAWNPVSRAPRRAGGDGGAIELHAARLPQPLGWRGPRDVCISSKADLFHPDVPDSFIDRVLAIVAWCGRHTFETQTSNPARAEQYFAGLTQARLQAALPVGYTLQFEGRWLFNLPLSNLRVTPATPVSEVR